MPERILRDLTDSDRYNAASVNARDTFIRIINKADDFGLYFADAKRLRPLLYPLLLDEVREADLSRWIAECVKSGLVRRYTADGREYLQVNRWRQRLRNKRSKYPVPPWGTDPPPEDDVGRPSDNRTAVVCHPRTETETETETEARAPAAGAAANPIVPKTSKGVEILEQLRTPVFLAAWSEWEKHLRQKHVRTTEVADRNQLAKCSDWGPAAASHHIRHSIAGNYQGIYPDKSHRENGSPATTPLTRARKDN